MASSDISTVTEEVKQLVITEDQEAEELNFSGQGLKLDSEKDADLIVEKINKCKRLIALRLEGNTLGVSAAKAIAKALESHSELKRALWKDMFTGRLKSEIPEALNFLSGGLMLANAKLTELDLSDNAFGQIGVKGIQVLIESQTCFQLQELRLNNNGLGISGGQMLADALLNCHTNCTAAKLPFCLRVFICGRNRLENEGAVALAKFFQAAGTLEEVEMPQNGIYHHGIAALATAFSKNPNLKVINLNDNTATEIGGRAIANAIAELKQLRVINVGDCLLRCAGSTAVAAAIKDSHQELEEFHMGFNEIRLDSALVVFESLKDKTMLKTVDLNGNLFGKEGCEKVREMFDKYLPKVLESLKEDEGGDDGEEDSFNPDEEKGGEEEVDEIEISANSLVKKSSSTISEPFQSNVTSVEAELKDFMDAPTSDKFLALGDGRSRLIMQQLDNDADFDERISVLLKVACVVTADKEKVQEAAFECADCMFEEMFAIAEKNDQLSVLSNSLLVQLGLIKSEDKTFTPLTDLSGPLIVLEHVVRQPYFSRPTKEVLQLFLSRYGPNKAMESCGTARHKLMQTLYRF